RPHEASIGVAWRADDRFATDIEAGIYDDAVACKSFELVDQLPVAIVGFTTHTLNARRVVDMSDCGKIGTKEIQPVVKSLAVVSGGKRDLLVLADRRDQQHVRRRPIKVEIFGNVFFQDRRSKR